MFKNLRVFHKLLTMLLTFVCLVLALAACGNEEATPVLTPVAVPSSGPFSSANIDAIKKQWEARLTQARQQWEAKNITGYDLQLTYTNTSWEPIQVIHVSLKDNRVVEHTRQFTSSFAGTKFTPGPVETTVESAAYTIPGLFDIAYSLVNSDWIEGETTLQIRFDPEYYFPTEIYQANARYTDVQQVWEVKMFKPL